MTDHVYLEPMNKGTNSENYYSTIDELKTPVLPKPSSPEDTSKEVENYYSTIDELKTPVLPKHSPHELPTKQKSTKYIIIVFLISLLLTTAAVFIYLFINRIIGAASGQILREELIPKTLCRSLAGCICSPIDENRYNCTCPKGTKCLLLKGPPKIYVDPTGPYDVAPGGGINISCTAVAHPFPEIYWQQHPETVLKITNLTDKRGATKSEQILTVKELHKNSNFTCHANNSIGKVERTVHVVVTGPGSAPILRTVNTNGEIRWEPPQIVNRPITGYTIYYTNNENQPIKNWKKIEVEESQRIYDLVYEIDFEPNIVYYIRMQANDSLGPGPIGNQVSLPFSLSTIQTLPPTEQYVNQSSPIALQGTQHKLHCFYSGYPAPRPTWYHNGREIKNDTAFKFESSGKTLIFNVTMDKSGKYDCRFPMHNPINNDIDRTFNVTVEAAPYWPEGPPPNTNTSEGETVTFDCTTNGIPVPVVTFYKNGFEMKKASDGEKWLIDGTKLTIYDVRKGIHGKGDNAVYQCKAENKHGNVWTYFYLNLLAIKPQLLRDPGEVEAVSGQFVTLEIGSRNEDGHIVGPDGAVLPTDTSGSFIYPAISFTGEVA